MKVTRVEHATLPLAQGMYGAVSVFVKGGVLVATIGLYSFILYTLFNLFNCQAVA